MSTDNESAIILTEAEKEGLAMPEEYDGDDELVPSSDGHPDFAKDDDEVGHDGVVDDEVLDGSAVDTAPEPTAQYEPVAQIDSTDYAELLTACVTKQTELADSLKDLNEKYADGEIDEVEFNLESKKIERALTRLEAKEEVYQEQIDAQQRQIEQTNQQMAQQWEQEQTSFFGKVENKVFAENDAMFEALNTHVKKLLAANVSLKDVLPQARANLSKDIEAMTGKPLQKTNDAPESKAKKEHPVIPTLGNVPAAIPNADGGRFTYLDNLSGRKLEEAMAKLSNDEREEYLTGVK
jgi:hypothetical protein